MLATAPQEIEDRAKRCVEMLTERFRGSPLQVSIVRGQSAVGGGAGPNTHPPTALICLQHETLSADEIQLRLRLSSTPVIARIAEQTVLIDLRTVGPDEELELLGAISRLTQSHASETAF
jgi:L-seryl-tRNA(Ser) seleniumtransferase